MEQDHNAPLSSDSGESKEDDRPSRTQETKELPSSARTSQLEHNQNNVEDKYKELSPDEKGTIEESLDMLEENTNADLHVHELQRGEERRTDRDVLPVDESIIEKLTVGFLQTFLPQAEHSNAELDELMRNQRVLIETLQQENAKFQESTMMSELAELMTEAKRYYVKLVHLRKEMISLHEKSTKLKKRALKLQHHKMKQSLQREQQRERELEQDKHLIAKPAKKNP